MVGAKGFEPSTSWSRTRRASQAALRPDKWSEYEDSFVLRAKVRISHGDVWANRGFSKMYDFSSPASGTQD
jgi:hypothetical protein